MGDTNDVKLVPDKEPLPKKRQLTAVELRQERLQTIEDDLLESTMLVTDGACRFGEIDPGDLETIPQEWINDLGYDRAVIRHRVAVSATKPMREAPIGITIAAKVVTGIIRARTAERATGRSLNINMITMTKPIPKYEVIDVEGD